MNKDNPSYTFEKENQLNDIEHLYIYGNYENRGYSFIDLSLKENAFILKESCVLKDRVEYNEDCFKDYTNLKSITFINIYKKAINLANMKRLNNVTVLNSFLYELQAPNELKSLIIERTTCYLLKYHKNVNVLAFKSSQIYKYYISLDFDKFKESFLAK